MATTKVKTVTPNAAAGKADHVYLIDGSGYIFRAYFALPPMTRADGTPVNAVYGFTTMLMKLLTESDAEYLAVIFDSGRATFRNEIYSDYKANRDEPPDELKPQFSLIRDAVKAFSLPCIELPGFEADDLIATYARLAAGTGKRVTIVSSDKDLMQLVGPGIDMLDPVKNKMIGPAEVEERFGVPPDKVIDVQALAGDSIDNVPGVPGIGVKTAAELIKTYGDLDTLLARAGEIKQPKRRETLLANIDNARMSRDLVRLKDDVPLPEPLEDFILKPPDHDKVLAFLRDMGFKSIIQRLETQHAASAGAKFPEHVAPTPADEKVGYAIVDEEATLAWWADEARRRGAIAIAVQGSSPDALGAELVGIALSIAAGRAVYVPLAHGGAQGDLTLERPKQIARDRALEILKPMLEDPAVLKIGHDIKYEMKLLARHGVTLAPVEDTMLLSYALEAGLHAHECVDVVKLFLGRDMMPYEDLCGAGKNRIAFAQAPLEKARDYAAENADMRFRLHAMLKPRLVSERVTTVYEALERPLIPVLAAMERAGIKVDAAELRRLSKDFEKRIAEFEKEIHKLAGREFNIGSPKQLGEVLFDELVLGDGRKGKTGAYGTGADVLEELAELGHELPAKVLDWRQLSKLKSTYTDALVEEIRPDTGRVHSNYAQAVASTGRLSSNDPNLQNIPIRTEEGKKIRRAFVAEPGCVLMSADYSQIELRLLAHVADIAQLKKAFKNGEDIHAITASEVFGVPLAQMKPEIRNRAKAINFGIIYGISAFGLARQLNIPQADARTFIEAYFKQYPGIKAYAEAARAFARQHGFVRTVFGRKCHLPGIADKNPARRNFAERVALNAPLQGAAADIIKRAMIRVPPALGKAGLKARMLLQVHDELIFEVPKDEIEATKKLVETVMSGAAHLSVPLVVEAGHGATWADAH